MDTKAKLLISAATSLGLCSTGAFAQSSVTLYGMVDLGVQYLTNANSKHDSVVGFQSGNVYPSNWGLTGREDLGGGYAAIFKLESGINMANGAMQSPTSFFNRSAYVGVSTPYGAITAGRQYKIMFDMSLYYDPTFQGQYSLLSAGLIPNGTTVANMVKYRSVTVGGLSGEAAYSFGQQQPGHMAAGTYAAAGLDYQFRSFSTRVVYEQTRGTVAAPVDTSSELDKRFSAAAKLRIGTATLFAGFLNVNGQLQMSPDGNMYWGGAYYQITPALGVSASVAHYQTRGEHGHPNWYFLEGTYNLSKQTSLYAFAGYLDVNGGKNFTLNYLDTSSPGNLNQTGVILGIRHAF
ncbi:porin [Paraburkholderia terrae]|uniref:porin n=1 Tax=Paraburkholderia TaxID=1822464 RepID=UPI001EE2734F|nr:porin [Paraburkholderia terrae]BEU21196.1 porin [Paraburkholderia sp. 22B1P]GJH06759.1 porin [Paraburkholderia terrae]GJH38694.1 porin [Paraburkholderia hospita]